MLDPVAEMAERLPVRDDLDEWQQIQYDIMLWMMKEQVRTNGTYKWVAGHDGCMRDHVYHSQKFLKAHKGTSRWTYCCGITLEHFFMSWEKFLGPKFLTERNMDPSFIWQLRGHFFVYRDPPENKYDRGAGGGIEALGKHLEKKAGEDDELLALFDYHTDPYTASFGDYLQLQNKEDIHSNGGGHSAIFVDVVEEGGKDAVLAFNSNIRNDYGFDPGIGLSWYRIGKKHKDTGFERVFHLGSVQL